MVSYNKIWLANLLVQEQLKKDLERKLITSDEFATITERYPLGFYNPKILTRVGLFILTCIIIIFADGLLALVTGLRAFDSAGWFLFLGALAYTALELMVQTKNHYKSGVDDALLIISGLLFGIALYFFLHKNAADSFLGISVIVFLVSFCLSIRFANTLAGTVSTAAIYAVILYGWVRTGTWGLTTAPFLLMLAAASLYWLARALKINKQFINYLRCLSAIQIVSLVTLYAAGNYYVVQMFGDKLKGTVNPVHTLIPIGSFFWGWTMLLPFVYIGFGIKKKNRLILRTGMVLVVAAAATFKNYYHVLPVNIELTIIGIVVLAAVYNVMRYLKTPKHGFTDADLNESTELNNINIESLLITETFSQTPAVPTEQGVKFGGGDFGGGGSSSSF